MEEKTFSRRTLLIKGSFQIKFVAWFIALLAIITAATGIALYLFGSQQIETAFASSGFTVDKILQTFKLMIVISQVTGLVTISLAAIFMVILFSHRLAGPLYRLEQSVEDVVGGRLDFSVTFRKNDELIPLKTAFNTMLATFTEHFRQLSANQEKLENIAGRLAAEPDISPSPELIAELNGIASGNREVLDHYRLGT